MVANNPKSDSELILRAIEQSIRFKAKNTIKDHIRSWLYGKRNYYSGMIDGNEFQIWKYTSATQGYYPVIHGTVKSVNDQPVINLKATMNPASIIFTLLGLTIASLAAINAGSFFGGSLLVFLFLVILAGTN